MLTLREIRDKSKTLYPNSEERRAGYVQGYVDALNTVGMASDKTFYEKVAEGLRKIWPSGEKDGKYPWRDSVSNLTKRLEFIWNDRRFGDKYSVEDCLRAGRRYVAQFTDNAKYMVLLKYFVFKQDKSAVDKSGKIIYTYKSLLADYLESVENSMPDEFESFDMLDSSTLI